MVDGSSAIDLANIGQNKNKIEPLKLNLIFLTSYSSTGETTTMESDDVMNMRYLAHSQ
jgi:hypothetical protein